MTVEDRYRSKAFQSAGVIVAGLGLPSKYRIGVVAQRFTL